MATILEKAVWRTIKPRMRCEAFADKNPFPNSFLRHCRYLEPYFLEEMRVDIRCLIQGMQLRFDHEDDRMAFPTPKNQLHPVEWAAIPGRSDTQKILRLLQAANVLPLVFRGKQTKVARDCDTITAQN